MRNEYIRRTATQDKWSWGGYVIMVEPIKWIHAMIMWEPRPVTRSVGRQWCDESKCEMGNMWSRQPERYKSGEKVMNLKTLWVT